MTARYRCRYIKRSTGRENTRELTARSEEDARAEMARLDDVSEVLWIERLDERPATQRQLDYLHDLDVRITEPITIHEASDLIENAQRGRKPAEARDHALAAHFGIGTTRFASKNVIFARITAGLDDDVDLARWYLFRVARHLGYEAKDQRDRHPGDADIVEAACRFVEDEKALRSLRRAARNSMCDFRWFGSFRGADGVEHPGESTATLAYEKAVALLGGSKSAARRQPHVVPKPAWSPQATPGRYAGDELPPVEERPQYLLAIILGSVLTIILIVLIAR